MRTDTAGYSGSTSTWIDIDRYRETAGYRGYGERQIQAGYRFGVQPEIQAGDVSKLALWKLCVMECARRAVYGACTRVCVLVPPNLYIHTYIHTYIHLHVACVL